MIIAQVLTPRVPPLHCWSRAFGSASQVYSERRVLGYTDRQMFKVVGQVEYYHQFVPWCKKSDVVFRDENGLRAELVIGFPPLIGEAYTSHVTLVEPHLVTAVCTDMQLFHHLKTVWRFGAGLPGHPKTTTLDFAVSFQFRNHVHTQISNLFFDEVIKRNVNAFLIEARCRYGAGSIPTQPPTIFAKS